jgi:hypothetical protein
MSVSNYFYNKLRALATAKKVVDGTYTVKVGSVSNGFQVDRVIDIDDPAANFTLTVPDGVEMGQKLLIVMSSNASSKTATISVTHHQGADSGTTSLDAADEAIELLWTGTEWDTTFYSCAADVS